MHSPPVAAVPLTVKGVPDRRFGPYCWTPGRKAALGRAQAAAAKREGFEILAQLDPSDGHWSWQSSPHVLWLANVLAGVRYD